MDKQTAILKLRKWFESDDFQHYLKTNTINNIEITYADIIDHYFDGQDDKPFRYMNLANAIVDDNYRRVFTREPIEALYPNVYISRVVDKDMLFAFEHAGVLFMEEGIMYFTHGYNDKDQKEMREYASNKLKWSSYPFKQEKPDLNGIVCNFGDGDNVLEQYSTYHVPIMNEYNDIRLVSLRKFLIEMYEIMYPEKFKSELPKDKRMHKRFVNLFLANDELYEYLKTF